MRKANQLKQKVVGILKQTSGSGFIEQAIMILTALIIGALLLAGLYALFSETVLPELQGRISEMFNYQG